MGGVVGSIATGLFGGSAQDKGSDAAANATRDAASTSANALLSMYNTSREDLAPIRALFGDSVDRLKSLTLDQDTYSGLKSLLNQYGNLATPTLQNTVDINYDSDPLYQANSNELAKMLNRRYASTGQMASSSADDALVRGQSALMSEAYNRKLDELNRTNQNALSQYGLDSGKIANLLGLTSGVNDTEYNRVMNMANMGQNASAQTANSAMQTGSGLSNIYQNQGNALSQIYQQQGMNKANMYGGMGAGINSSLNNYLLMSLL